MNTIIRSLTVALLTLVVVCLWSFTVRAAVYEETCTRRPMAQGTVGEMVTECTLRRVASRVTDAAPVKRVGRTTVVARLGTRRPSPLRLAALDSNGTCGGLPAVCCNPLRGSRVVCGGSSF